MSDESTTPKPPSLEDVLLMLNERAMSEDPGVAATSRLNRRICTAVDAFAHDEWKRGTSRADLYIACLHACGTIMGSLLVNLPKEHRDELGRMLMSALAAIMAEVLKKSMEEE